MGKPGKIVLKSDEEKAAQKRFGAGVFDLVRTKLAPAVGGNINLAVKLAAEYFTPRKPSEVTAAEMGDAIPQIAAKFKIESGRNENGQLPLNDETQKLWDSGQWRGKLTVRGLAQRYAAEIKDGVDLTLSMVEAYAAELAAEKAAIAKLVDEHDDPDSRPVACGSPVHRGNEPFQPTVAFRLERNSAGELARRKHAQGDEYIVQGNFLILKGEDGAVTGQVAYCPSCREAARKAARSTEPPMKLTFYTAAGLRRVQDAAKKSAEDNATLFGQLRSASSRTYGGTFATRKGGGDRDWKINRGRK